MYNRSKQAKTAKVYGNPTGKKQYKKLDADSMINATIKAEIAKAASRQIAKTIETQYSYALMTMITTTGTTTDPNLSNSGFKLWGLNQYYVPVPTGAATGAAGTGWQYTGKQMFVFNLSSLSRVRSATETAVSGYRVGNKCNVNSIEINVFGEVIAPDVDGASYHGMIVRSKDGARAKYALQPKIANADELGLWKPMSDGPLAASNTGQGVSFPVPEKLSLMRRNYDAWTYPASASMVKTLRTTETSSNYKQNIDMNLYFKVDSVWDFTSALPGDSPVLKGGDYFFVLWREGAEDSSSRSNIGVHFAMSFKDA